MRYMPSYVVSGRIIEHHISYPLISRALDLKRQVAEGQPEKAITSSQIVLLWSTPRNVCLYRNARCLYPACASSLPTLPPQAYDSNHETTRRKFSIYVPL